jgi:hypothetical protein
MPGGQARAAVEAAVVRGPSVRAARLLGKTKDSVALAETVTDEARRAAWRPLISDALLEWTPGGGRRGLEPPTTPMSLRQ